MKLSDICKNAAMACFCRAAIAIMCQFTLTPDDPRRILIEEFKGFRILELEGSERILATYKRRKKAPK